MEINIFSNIEEKDLKYLINCLEIKQISFPKDSTIAAYMSNTNIVGIIKEGEANIVRYDYNGNRTIVEELKENSIFGKMFNSSEDSEFTVVAKSFCTVLFVEYENVVKRCKKACPFHSIFVSNLLMLMSQKIIQNNRKIEILSNRSIREKLRAYFAMAAKQAGSKTFTMKMSYTDLADYLVIDRSAMSREIKNLKDDGIIKTNNKKITILY